MCPHSARLLDVVKGGDSIEITCEACGERNPAGSAFCLFCGAFLNWEGAEADQSAPEATAAGSRPRSATEAPGTVRAEPRALEPRALEPSPALAATETVDAESTRPHSTAPHPPASGPLPGTCPACGHQNEPQRRFCTRCGMPLHRRESLPAPLALRRRWWHQFTDSEERRSRRAYRRSLPAFYRWRRWIFTLIAVLVLVVGSIVVGRDPMQFVRSLWHDVRGDVVTVDGVRAVAEPEGSELPGFPAANAVDGDDGTAWSTAWTQRAPGSQCSALTGSGAVTLALPPTRIRELRVVSGLTDPSQRSLQLLPRVLLVTTSDNVCRVVRGIGQGATTQTLPFDSEVPVTSLRIAVAETHDAVDARAENKVSLTQVTLMARPG